MRRLILVPALCLGLCSAGPGVSAAETPSAEESELWEKMNLVFQRASGQYQRQDYRKAVESYRELLSLIPAGDAEHYNQLRAQAHYSLAGSHALLKEEKEALIHLEKAIENGLTDPRHLERNSDFDSLRRSPGFAALGGKMQAQLREEERRQLQGLEKFDFDVVGLDGKSLRKKDFLGKVLIVDIWGTWCPPCIMEVPHFVELQKRYGAEGLRIVGLNSEKIPDPARAATMVRGTMERLKVNYPCALAPEAVLRSVPNLRGFPTTLFFARDGSPRAMEVGYKDLAALETIVKRLLAEPAPAAPAAPQAPAAPGASKSPRGEPEKTPSRG